VNGRFLGRPVTGVERYAWEVAQRLSPRLRIVRAPGWAQGVRGHLWEQLLLPRALHAHELLWSPANTGPVAVENQVVTLHDVSPLDHPEWFRGAFASLYRRLLPQVTRRARRIITSSRFSRERIVETCGVPEDRVAVVVPGVDAARFRPPSTAASNEVRVRHGLPERYLLAVGSRSQRKNVAVLVTAWRSLRVHDRELGLVLVGDATHTARGEVSAWGDAGIRRLGRIPDADLPALYGAAAVFVYPSLYEGFGLPVLEAMACGTPVVASCRTSVPEAVGGAGKLFDPTEPDELAAVLERLLNDAVDRRDLRSAGLRRARALTWERTADGVLGVLAAEGR